MRFLETMNAEQQQSREGPSHLWLRAISPETGRLLALLAAAAPPGVVLELGTSGGYSTLWLALAASATNRKIKTFEILEEKVRLARQTLRAANVESRVQVITGDAMALAGGVKRVSFCFVDLGPPAYRDCYEQVIPNMVAGGILVADNIISHHAQTRAFVDVVMADSRVDAMTLPVGKGLLVCRKTGASPLRRRDVSPPKAT